MGVPTGFTGQEVIALIRNYANEPNLPPDSVVLGFANQGLQEVGRRIGAPRLWAPYPTVVNQTTVQLNNDVLDVVSANFSIGNASSQSKGSASPFAQGTLVYPMTQLEQAAFMDAAAGFPAVGFGPPQAYFIYQDAGVAPSPALPIPPAPGLSVISAIAFLTWNAGDWNIGFWYGPVPTQIVEVGITLVDASGETPLSLVADASISTAQQVQVASPGQQGASGYNVYAGPVGGPYTLQNTGGPVGLGTAYDIPPPYLVTATQPPTVNTSGGAGGGGSLFMQLYPAAMAGQVNVYYRARPQVWADNTPNSWTNLDTSAQEAVVLYAVGKVLVARSRLVEWTQGFKADYEAMVESLRESIQRRTVPRSGQVRDVANRSFPSSPFWLR